MNRMSSCIERNRENEDSIHITKFTEDTKRNLFSASVFSEDYDVSLEQRHGSH